MWPIEKAYINRSLQLIVTYDTGCRQNRRVTYDAITYVKDYVKHHLENNTKNIVAHN